MKRVSFHEDAAAEMIEAARYYEERAQGLGLSFLGAMAEAIEAIQSNPETFPLVGLKVRHKIAKRFPYSILYFIDSDRIRILAIAHQKRRPGYWKHRL